MKFYILLFTFICTNAVASPAADKPYFDNLMQAMESDPTNTNRFCSSHLEMIYRIYKSKEDNIRDLSKMTKYFKPMEDELAQQVSSQLNNFNGISRVIGSYLSELEYYQAQIKQAKANDDFAKSDSLRNSFYKEMSKKAFGNLIQKQMQSDLESSNEFKEFKLDNVAILEELSNQNYIKLSFKFVNRVSGAKPSSFELVILVRTPLGHENETFVTTYPGDFEGMESSSTWGLQIVGGMAMQNAVENDTNLKVTSSMDYATDLKDALASSMSFEQFLGNVLPIHLSSYTSDCQSMIENLVVTNSDQTLGRNRTELKNVNIYNNRNQELTQGSSSFDSH